MLFGALLAVGLFVRTGFDDGCLYLPVYGSVGLSPFFLGIASRFRRTKKIRVDEDGVHLPDRTLSWASIRAVRADNVEWRLDGGDSGGHSNHIEHAVIRLDRPRSRPQRRFLKYHCYKLDYDLTILRS